MKKLQAKISDKMKKHIFLLQDKRVWNKVNYDKASYEAETLLSSVTTRMVY